MTDRPIILTEDSQPSNSATGTVCVRNYCIMAMGERARMCGAPANEGGYFCNRHDDSVVKPERVLVRRKSVTSEPLEIELPANAEVGYDKHGIYKIIRTWDDYCTYAYLYGGDSLSEKKIHVGILSWKRRISATYPPDTINNLIEAWNKQAWEKYQTSLLQNSTLKQSVACRDNCWEASGLKCICSCGGRNHSIALNPYRREEYENLWSDLHASR